MMMPLKCDLCGSNDFVKDGDFFVCQHCKTKYTKEEAQKIMGTVKIDNTDKIEKAYKIARQSIQTSDFESAIKYYDEIRQENPNDWEATIYSAYSKAMSCKIIAISSAADSITRNTPLAYLMIKKHISDPKEQAKAYSEVASLCLKAANALSSGARNHYYGIDTSIRDRYIDEYKNRILHCSVIDYTAGEELINIFGENDLTKSLACQAYKNGIEIEGLALKVVAGEKLTAPILNDMKSWEKKAQKYDPNYFIPEETKKDGGCYVATCIYGSYDCPQVWTLRRYRDLTLANSWYGRAFIRTYYAISPTLVKWFGNTDWFKRMWKPRLDAMVENLKKKGVDSTPYQDIEW